MNGQKQVLRTTHVKKAEGDLKLNVECLNKDLLATFYTSSQPFQIDVYLPDSKLETNSCSSG